MHPEFSKFVVADHVAVLQRNACRTPRAAAKPAVDTRDVELRLCRVSDDPQLEALAVLEGRPLPYGRLVVASVRGCIVAAAPLAGGYTLRDPFARTEHIVKLLEVRTEQLREPPQRRWLRPRAFGMVRRSSHA